MQLRKDSNRIIQIGMHPKTFIQKITTAYPTIMSLLFDNLISNADSIIFQMF